MSRRESEVLAELGERRTNAEIAARLFISERTVESHVSSLLRKLQTTNRLELSDIARSLRADVDVGRLPAPLELAAESSTLVGRQLELDRLLGLWRRVGAGETLVAVVTGEAGIGKSRLIAELADRAHRDGGRVVLGACFEDTQTPYEAFVRAIIDDVDKLADDEIIRRAGRRASLLARLVPDLRGLLGVDEEDPARFEDMRADLLDIIHGYFTRSADHGPIVLVIEDLHWATATTRNAVQHIARTGGHNPLLVLVTARDSLPDADDDLRVLLGALDRMPAVERIALSGLTAAEVDELVGQVEIDDLTRSDAVADARGNPLFIREIAMAGRGSSGASINGLLLRRFARLEPDELAVINAASVIGAEFDSVLLSTCAQRPLLEILEVLDRAVAAGLVASSPDPRGRFSFAHPLLRTACYDALRSSDRVALHHRVAVALEERDDDTLASELARHACIAAPLFDPRSASEFAMRAARLAERSLALDEAVHHCRDALQVAQLAEPDRRRIVLQARIQLARLLQRTGHPESRQLLLDASETAREMGSALALAEIVWAMAHDGSTTTPGAMDPAFVVIAEDALARLGDESPAWRARVLAALSTHHAVGGDPALGVALSDQALGIARRLDDRVTLGFVLLGRRYSGGTPLRPEQRMAIGDELVALGALTASPLFTVFGHSTVLWSHRELGQLDAHDVALDAFEAALGERNLAYARLLLELGRANQWNLRGDLAAAQRHIEAAIALTPAAGMDAVSFCGPLLNAVRHGQGRIGELAGLIERATVTQPGFHGTYDAALALAYAHANRMDDARAIIDRYASDEFEGVSPNLAMTSGLVLFADAAEVTEHVAASRRLLIALEPHRELLADNGASVRGSVDLAIAQCALTIGEPAYAKAVAGRAVLASRHRGTPIFLARELVRLAVASQQLGAGRDVVEPLVAEAQDLARRTGAELVGQELRRYRLAG